MDRTRHGRRHGAARPVRHAVRRWATVLVAVSVGILLVGCDKVFDTHPYHVRVTGEKGINERNILRIEAICKGRDTIRIALISDSHLWLTDAKEAVASINERADSIDFVMHLGDLTDTGTIKEFYWIREVLSRLRLPYVALIGNHDYLGTGDEIYDEMYGAHNFSFVVGDVKMVCIDTNATEFDYMADVPDFDYMYEEIHNGDKKPFSRTIIVMHAPPFSNQFNNNVAYPFENFIQMFPGLMCCLNGHGHGFASGPLFDDGVNYHMVPSVVKRAYYIFTITPSGYSYEKIDF